jgi:hypothetical protein
MRQILDILNSKIRDARTMGDKVREAELVRELQSVLEGEGTRVWGR